MTSVAFFLDLAVGQRVESHAGWLAARLVRMLCRPMSTWGWQRGFPIVGYILWSCKSTVLLLFLLFWLVYTNNNNNNNHYTKQCNASIQFTIHPTQPDFALWCCIQDLFWIHHGIACCIVAYKCCFLLHHGIEIAVGLATGCNHLVMAVLDENFISSCHRYLMVKDFIR